MKRNEIVKLKPFKTFCMEILNCISKVQVLFGLCICKVCTYK